eukprot:4444237-Prymnesium_polylepis.1
MQLLRSPRTPGLSLSCSCRRGKLTQPALACPLYISAPVTVRWSRGHPVQAQAVSDPSISGSASGTAVPDVCVGQPLLCAVRCRQRHSSVVFCQSGSGAADDEQMGRFPARAVFSHGMGWSYMGTKARHANLRQLLSHAAP